MELPSYLETNFLEGRFFGFPNTIKLEGETVNKADGEYGVYIRDASECLLVKAEVNKEYGTIRFINSNGDKYLEVKSNLVGGDNEGGTDFKVFHHDMQIGIGLVTDALNFKLCNTYENRTNYRDNSLKVGDIVVLRETYAPPICNMHLPGGSPDSESETYAFDGVITFPDGESVTKVEQCLCLSLAIVFLISQNRVRIVKASEGQCQKNCLVCLCLFLFGLALYFAWILLDAFGCSRRKASGRIGYKDRDCSLF